MQSRTGNRSYNAIDPTVLVDAGGRLWMAFGSFWKGIFLVELNPQTGLRSDTTSTPRRLAWSESIEAPCLARRGNDYYLFVNWGSCCRGTNSTYQVRVGRSQNITGPYVDREGRNLVDRGGTLFLESGGRFIGPGHIGLFTVGATNWFSYHYYDAHIDHIIDESLKWHISSFNAKSSAVPDEWWLQVNRWLKRMG